MIRISRVAERYSTALFRAAKSEKNLEAVEKDLNALDAMIAEHKQFAEILLNPLFGNKNIEDIFTDVSLKLKFNKLTTNFLKLLTRNGRLSQVHPMVLNYKKLLMQERGQLAVDVWTNTALSDEQLKKIGNSLQQSTGKEIRLQEKRDSSVLGGMVIKYGSYKLDFSLRRKLNELKHALERLS